MKTASTLDRFPHLFALSLAILFFLLGLAIAPYPGIQTDEALFTNVLFNPPATWFEISVFKKKVPLMVMSYVGSLKAGLFAVIFHFWEPSAFSLRLPMIILGSVTIFLFYLLVKQSIGVRAALFAAALLATDACFLLTIAMDWGPVALQHLCLVAGTLFVLRFHQTASRFQLSAGFFLFGLGVWDKALFLWMLSALAIATIAIFPRDLAHHFRLGHLVHAVVFFCLGAAPLIIYNVRRPLATFRGNASFSIADTRAKVKLLPGTLNGVALFGYMVREDWADQPRLPQTTIERLSTRLSDAAGRPRKSLQAWAFAAALLLTPALWRTPARRPLLFCLVFMLVAWAQMLITSGAGGGAHHTILLWPFPIFLIAVAFSQASEWLGKHGPAVLALTGALLCGTNLLVVNQYLAQMVRNGCSTAWSNAIFMLAPALEQTPAKRVYLIDWGMTDNLRLLTKGRLPVIAISALMNPTPDQGDRRNVEFMLEDTGSIFVSFTDAMQIYPGVNQRLKSMATAAGYQREPIRTIADGNGRPTYEIFRYQSQEKRK